MRLTPTQAAELIHVLAAEPNSVHEHDRDPFEWVRFVSRRSTVEALVRRGLCETPIMHDYPVGGYRARLTRAGLVERTERLAAIEARRQKVT